MKKAFSFILCISLMVSLTSCKKSPRLDIESFEKYVLSDLQLEKKDISTQDLNAYYDLDNTIDNTDASPRKRDHYVEVYSKSESMNIANMYMVYTDYQLEEDARSYYDELIAQEQKSISESPSGIVSDSGKNYFLVLTHDTATAWRFECLYIDKDVILFTAIIFAASGPDTVDTAWLGRIKECLEDLHIKHPFALSPEINDLLK